MTLVKRGIVFAALLSPPLAGCATSGVAARKAQYVPVPGYVCTVGKAFEDEIWIGLTLDANGVQREAHLEWKPKIGDIWQPSVMAVWSSTNERAFDIDNGTVSISWTFKEESRAGRRPYRLGIELSTRSDPPFWPRPPFSDDKSMASRMILANWSDLRALVRGSERLFLVLRDRKRGAIFRQAELSRSLFVEGEAKAVAALAQMKAKAAAYRAECTPVADVVDRDIII